MATTLDNAYRPESVLGAVARDLLGDLERVRPGLEAASEEELREQLKPRLAVRLREIYRDSYAAADALVSDAPLGLYQREIEQILLPRYAALALRQNRSERAPTRPGEGADLFNRIAWATLFGLLGAFVVWAPFIPIWEKWIPFAAAALAALFSPALPDLHRRLTARRHQLALTSLLLDMDAAGRALPMPENAEPALLPPPAQKAKEAQ